jgi:hypothetical protein
VKMLGLGVTWMAPVSATALKSTAKERMLFA